MDRLDRTAVWGPWQSPRRGHQPAPLLAWDPALAWPRLTPASPEAPPFSIPACPGLLNPEQPFGSITLPLIHSSSLRLTPEQFVELCQANPDAVLELAADGSLIPMTPTGQLLIAWVDIGGQAPSPSPTEATGALSIRTPLKRHCQAGSSSWGGSRSSTTAAAKPTSRQAERSANRRLMALLLECCQRLDKRDVTGKRQGSTKKPC